MAGVRSMLARVKRIEAARAPVLSPIALAFGSFETHAAFADQQVAAGVLDRLDFPVVVHCLRRWEADRTWGTPWGHTGAWGASR